MHSLKSRITNAAAVAILAFFFAVSFAGAQETDIVLPDSNAALWTLIVGVGLPIVIATITQQQWASQVKGYVTAAASLVASLGIAYFNDMFEGKSITFIFLAVILLATQAYARFWKPTGIAPAIEEKTTL